MIEKGRERDVEFYITDKPLDSLEEYNLNLDYLMHTSSQQLRKLFAVILHSQRT